jgi:hypothetical protein
MIYTCAICGSERPIEIPDRLGRFVPLEYDRNCAEVWLCQKHVSYIMRDQYGRERYMRGQLSLIELVK